MEEKLANMLAEAMLFEYEQSKEKYGRHNSGYEAYGAILEEMREFEFAEDMMEKSIELFWVNIMNGEIDNSKAIMDVVSRAVRAAAELIQIAAAAYKCNDGYVRDDDEDDGGIIARTS